MADDTNNRETVPGTTWGGMTEDEIADIIDGYLNAPTSPNGSAVELIDDEGYIVDSDGDFVCLGEPLCDGGLGTKHTQDCNDEYWGRDEIDFPKTSTTSSSSFSFGKSWGHKHRQEPYTLSDGTVILCSSHHYRNDDEQEPDMACYLDGIWTPGTVAFHLGWRDFGLPYLEMDQVRVIADELLAAARNGKRVEIGCIGGHGRTGTFLAILDILSTPEGEADPKAIMERIWNTYCKQAIETSEQEWYIEAWAAAHNGQEIPAKPVKPVPAPKSIKLAPVKGDKPAAKSGKVKGAKHNKGKHRKAGMSRYNNTPKGR